MVRTLRFIGGLGLTVAALAAGLWLLAWMARPDLSERPQAYSQEEIEAAKRARDVRFDPSDPSKLPRIQVDVDYSQGRAAPWWPRRESPILAELVEEGVLPPLEERVGPMPIVLRGVEGIGRYGGTWLRVSTTPDDVGQMVRWRLSYSGLFRWSPLGYPIVPHLAKSLTPNEDYTQWVLEIRPGLRWSDGHPFTVDDILYWFEYENLDTAIGGGTAPMWLRTYGKPGRLEKIDDLRMRFVFEHPYALMPEILACYSYGMTDSPRHYLSRYHPSLGNREFIEAEMRAFRMPSPRALYTYVRHFQNPESRHAAAGVRAQPVLPGGGRGGQSTAVHRPRAVPGGQFADVGAGVFNRQGEHADPARALRELHGADDPQPGDEFPGAALVSGGEVGVADQPQRGADRG
jgi:hypothetical protein